MRLPPFRRGKLRWPRRRSPFPLVWIWTSHPPRPRRGRSNLVALRTRIAVTFILLLAAVLAAALGAVSATNHGNAEREVQRQLTVGVSVFSRLLESNRRQLTQAAQAVAADYGFREAVATRDTDTLVSVLENSGERIGAGLVVLTSLNGEVIAASGLQVKAGTAFPVSPLQRSRMADEGSTSLMVDNGRIFEF